MAQVLRTARRSIAVSAIAATVALGFMGVSAPAQAAGTTLTVLDYYNNEPDNTMWQNVISKCADSVGATIDRTAVPGDTLIQKILQMASSQTLPDLLMIDNPDLQSIAATGALAQLDQFGVKAATYAPGIVAASKYQGKAYGLQPTTNTIALFYNKDIFKKAGVKVPTTWAELKVTAKKLSKGKQYGIAFSAPANYEGTWQFLPFFWSAGADETKVNSPATVKALQLWIDLVKSGAASKSVVTWTQADVRDQFMAGNAAMMINGPWQFPTLKTKPSLHWAVAKIPAPSKGTASVAPLGGETWAIPNTGNSAKMALAAKVLQCMNSDANQLYLSVQTGKIPTNMSLWAQFTRENPEYKGFADQVKTARSRSAKLGADWPKAATQIYKALQYGLAGGMSAKDAVAKAVR